MAHGEEGFDSQLLEDDSTTVAQPTLLVAVPRIDSQHQGVTAVSAKEPFEDLNARGLAGSIGSEQGKHVALLHFEGHVLDGVEDAVKDVHSWLTRITDVRCFPVHVGRRFEWRPVISSDTRDTDQRWPDPRECPQPARSALGVRDNRSITQADPTLRV
jgi:hypothetical protein